MSHLEIHSYERFETYVSRAESLENVVIQGLDLRNHEDTLLKVGVNDAVFLGCYLSPTTTISIMERGGLVFPRLKKAPFNPYRGELYSVADLMGGYKIGEVESYEQTLDCKVYRHFVASGRAQPASIMETLARRLHDHAITDALEELIAGQRIVAIMGGHALGRDNPHYAAIVRLARELARREYLLASGGGPGAMEATHLGVYLAKQPEEAVTEAIDILSEAPLYKNITAWLDTAFTVRERFPAGADAYSSLGIPTWHYGHEPPNVFPTHIAKYFANSVREEGLLAIAKGGIVFAPGSAGTIQEIFQDATQNHYQSFDGVSPMIFLGEAYWKWTKPVFPLLAQLAAGHKYASHLHITDEIDRVVALIEQFHGS